jgi:hypothetical protein
MLSTLLWSTSYWHQAKMISRVFTKICIFPSLVISLNFKQIIFTKFNIFNWIAAEPENVLVFITKLGKKPCHPMVKFESFINTYTHTMYVFSIQIHEIRIQPRTHLCVVWNRPAGATLPNLAREMLEWHSDPGSGELATAIYSHMLVSFTQLYTPVLSIGFLRSSVFAELALPFSLCICFFVRYTNHVSESHASSGCIRCSCV